MDFDDAPAGRPAPAAGRLAEEDLDRLSIDELDRRIALLEAELARTWAQRADAAARRAAADSLFRKPR
jgi:uncharacterized small protein (DUF1192 family)